MNPEIEPILEEAFASIGVQLEGVGHVSLEPDYETKPSSADVQQIRNELLDLLRKTHVESHSLSMHDGQSLDFQAYPALRRFVRSIALHGGPKQDPWLDVVPPGNWI